MSETSTHFIADCPRCAARLKINRKHIGLDVVCKHCEHSFRAEPRDELSAPSVAENRVAPWPEPAPTAERIAVSCPSCHTGLSVRRVYIGNQVQCKQCGKNFVVRDPALTQQGTEALARGELPVTSSEERDSEPRLREAVTERERIRAEHEQLLAEHQRLQADHDQLETNVNRLQIEIERLGRDRANLEAERHAIRAERDATRAECESARADCDSARADCEIARAECDSARAECESARAERDKASAERDSARAECESACAERDSARAQCDALAPRLEQLTHDLDETHGERGRLNDDLSRVSEEVKQLRSALDERERASGTVTDAHRDEIEGLRRGLEVSEQNHHFDRVRLAERAQFAEEKERAAAVLESECERLRAEVERLRQVDESPGLRQQLEVADRLNRELSAILGGMGITYNAMMMQKESTR